ncbi:MAG: FoF1 ATP synthase subunit gamma [Brevefilum sp.]|nr:F0F1 ATP synthase subunit gamma [Brevefilum sp.]MDT8381458.1 FoF1 ATP synthase subunit gamma [Brevefilum sp.]MDW7753676.1 FoF1 ATP synthase subunit gamma [Brevefilum sp.]
MESINEIQNRLEGLEDIKHLLRSVRAMSAIRWRRAKKHLEIAQSYAASVDAQLGTILMHTGGALPQNMRETPSSTGEVNVGLITLTSDRGLCGNFNTELIAKAMFVRNILNKKNKKVKIISLGGYGERMFQNAGYEIFYTEKIPSSQAVSFINMRKVIAHIQAFYESKAIDELNILYNRFNYFGSYTPKSIQILPPKLSDLTTTPTHPDKTLMVNSDTEQLTSFLLWEHLAAQLYLAFIESTISEHSARLQTMDSAISSLDERVSELEIQYHTIRQEKITQDVLEVQSNIREHSQKGK